MGITIIFVAQLIIFSTVSLFFGVIAVPISILFAIVIFKIIKNEADQI